VNDKIFQSQQKVHIASLQDTDDNILPLYNVLEQLDNRRKRTGPHVPSRTIAQSMSPDDIYNLRRLLKARFRRHRLQSRSQSSDEFEKQDDKDVLEFSEKKLKNLWLVYRTEELTPTIRKRVYASQNPCFALPGPSFAVASDSPATMLVIHQGWNIRGADKAHSSIEDDFDQLILHNVLYSVDIVIFLDHKSIVCTADDNKSGTVHYRKTFLGFGRSSLP
jgi:hypothetical protein